MGDFELHADEISILNSESLEWEFQDFVRRHSSEASPTQLTDFEVAGRAPRWLALGSLSEEFVEELDQELETFLSDIRMEQLERELEEEQEHDRLQLQDLLANCTGSYDEVDFDDEEESFEEEQSPDWIRANYSGEDLDDDDQVFAFALGFEEDVADFEGNNSGPWRPGRWKPRHYVPEEGWEDEYLGENEADYLHSAKSPMSEPDDHELFHRDFVDFVPGSESDL